MEENKTILLRAPEELVGLIKEGETVYFEELFTRFLPLVKKMNAKYYLRFMEKDDFWQEARIVLHKAVVAYDSEKGLQFSGFFKLMLEHHVYSLIRKETALKRKIDKGAVSLDQLMENEAGSHSNRALNGTTMHQVSPEDVVQVRESATGYFDGLSLFEQDVFRLYLLGKEFPMIAEELDCEMTQIKNAFDRCKQKMKRLLS